VEQPAAVSADGSTLVMGGSRPRVGAISSMASAASLELSVDEIVTGPVALTADGTAAAAVVDPQPFGRHIVTFDGRTGAVLGTIEIRPSFDNAPDDVDIIRLLVSDEVVVIQRQEDDLRSFLRRDVIEVHRRGGGAPRIIDDRPGGSAIWLTSGPGAALYVAGADGVVTAYPVNGGAPFEVLDVDSIDPVTALGTELPGGGQLMAVGYASGRVELWNLATSAFIAELSRHGGPVQHAVVGDTTAGLRVTTVSGGVGVVRTLNDPNLLRDALCRLSGRDLSEAEWRRFVGAGEPLACARGLP
jgi:WD40 repeat protein